MLPKYELIMVDEPGPVVSHHKEKRIYFSTCRAACA